MVDRADALFSTPEMSRIFSAENHVRQMLAFESALARAEARAGVIPSDAATAIAAACRVERFDVAGLYRDAALAGTLAIPLVRELTALVTEEGRDFVHWGATSQDTVDTATVLQIRDGLDQLEGELLGIATACAGLAERYRHTLMPGRTLLQQALPITFGLKAARWLALTTRLVARLRATRSELLVVQFGGASGTLAALGNRGLQVTELLAEELALAAPALPWHTERDRFGVLAGEFGVVAGGMAKIAEDLALLAQTEVGEVSEGQAPGKGGSSAMPQKRNPVDATMALASARLAIGQVPILLGAMVQQHERAVGGWQAEWAALPTLFCSTASTVARVRSALEGLEVGPERMRANLDQTNGLIMAESLTMALAPRLGRPEAYRRVQAACTRAVQEGIDLQQAALADDRIRSTLPDGAAGAIDRVFDPAAYLGSTDAFIDRALTTFQDLQPFAKSS